LTLADNASCHWLMLADCFHIAISMHPYADAATCRQLILMTGYADSRLFHFRHDEELSFHAISFSRFTLSSS
jgi:hypothetical protein